MKKLETVINKELKKLDTWLIVNRLSLNIAKTNGSASIECNETATRSKKDLPNLKSNCFFCGFKKHNKDIKLCLIQYENSIQQLKTQCNLKNDIELRRKIGGDFSKLPALDAKYHA